MAITDYSATPGSNTTISGINIAEGCAPSGINNAFRQIMADIAAALDAGTFSGTGYATKSAGYTVVAGDRGRLIEATAALTLSLTAAATLGAGFVFTVRASGGNVTIDPNGSETVDGGATLTVHEGSSAVVVCDGSAFHTSGPAAGLDLDALPVTATWQAGSVSANCGLNLLATANADIPDIGLNVSLANSAEPATPANAYKVGIGAHVESSADTPHLYGGNTIVDGKAGSGNGFLTGFEANVNNRGDNADTLSASTAAYGVVATGLGTKRCTAAFWSAGQTAATAWNYGFAGSGHHNAATFYDSSNATAGMVIAGTHTMGIDMTDSTMGRTLDLPNNVPIQQENTGATLLTVANITNGNLLDLGSPSVAYIRSNQSIIPLADNTYLLGTDGIRWSSVWAANGTIQTSDVALKTDIKPLPDVGALFDAIDPITFRWIEGGREMVEVEEAGLVQASEDIEVIRLREVDGEWREVKQTKRKLLYDEVVLSDGSTAHRPRMVHGRCKKTVSRPVPGKRTHWGFDAEQIGRAFAGLGVDFGGYVETKDGTRALRPDQLIPVLWKMVQELRGEVAALKRERRS